MLITVENAVEMAKRGHESRRLRKQQEALRAAEAAANPQIAEPITEPPSDFYVTQRKACVRAQLRRVDEMILEEDDPQRLDRLASAQARLSEQERLLDGRPLPGSRKPAADKATKRGPMPDPT